MLRFRKAKNAELAWLDAEIAEPEEDNDLVGRGDEEPKEKLMVLQPVDDGNQVVPHNPLFINDVKLTDFKQVSLFPGSDSLQPCSSHVWNENYHLRIKYGTLIYVLVQTARHRF